MRVFFLVFMHRGGVAGFCGRSVLVDAVLLMVLRFLRCGAETTSSSSASLSPTSGSTFVSGSFRGVALSPPSPGVGVEGQLVGGAATPSPPWSRSRFRFSVAFRGASVCLARLCTGCEDDTCRAYGGGGVMLPGSPTETRGGATT